MVGQKSTVKWLPTRACLANKRNSAPRGKQRLAENWLTRHTSTAQTKRIVFFSVYFRGLELTKELFVSFSTESLPSYAMTKMFNLI